ncbi:MAG: 8-oxo-dGTP diphosphatase [Kiritimatiellae bacterium]|jgi:8-oxo-dGTP diphosphatase|nr:8-oxo-dGTP diphosphatase [Kiritimatiellia bacterium]
MRHLKKLSEIDWKTWEPKERATLLFVIRDGQALLIDKKKGLGAGKVNAPGGRVEKGETAQEAAIREVEEELCVTPLNVSPRGRLNFQFTDGYSLQGHVFWATDCRGEPQETCEAVPRWTPLDDIPYDKMWADDLHWIPLMLEGKHFEGHFIFDDDTMLDHALITFTPEEWAIECRNGSGEM